MAGTNNLLNMANQRGHIDQGHLEKTLLIAYKNSHLDNSVKELKAKLISEPIYSALKEFALDHKKALNPTQVNPSDKEAFAEEVFVNLSLKPKLLATAINKGIIDMEQALSCFASMLEHQKKDGEKACFSFLTKIDTASNNNSIDKQRAQFASQLPETLMQFIPQSTAENVRWIVAILNLIARMQMMDIDIEGGAYQRLDNRLSKLLEIHNMAKRGGSNEQSADLALDAGANNPESSYAEATIEEDQTSPIRARLS